MGNEFCIQVPGDKSLTHRALLFAALSSGQCTIHRHLDSEDIHSTVRVLRQLGIAIDEMPESLVVQGRGGHLEPSAEPLDCGNSGTTARLMLGVLAGTGTPAVVTGDASLRRRPSRRVTDPLAAMGGRFGRKGPKDGFPVEVVAGVQHAGDIRSSVSSAQVKSAVLLAGLTAGVPVRYREPGRSRDHTERLLRALGQHVDERDDGIHFEPGGPVAPFRYVMPGDPSSAAFLVAGILFAGTRPARLTDVLLNPTRVGFIEVLTRMGADVRATATDERWGESVGDIDVAPSTLAPTVVSAAEVPSLIDEIPVLAVVAARADGQTRFVGVEELRVKESDRLSLLVDNLVRLGVEASVEGNDLLVRGPIAPSAAARIESGGDHRIAMAFATLGLSEGIDIEMSETHSPDVSFPGFQRILRTIVS